MDYDGMDDAMTNQANKQPGLLRRLGTTGAIIVAACLAAGATFLGYGVDANLPWPVTANTTIAPKYCGGTVLAGTGSTGQFTLTLPAVTGFPTNCSVLIKNGDSTNSKFLSGFPADANDRLWPLQQVGVKVVNGAWSTFYAQARWMPASPPILYASATGSNSNDCLTSGTACQLSYACPLAGSIIGNVTVQLLDGTFSGPLDGLNQLCSNFGISGNAEKLVAVQGDCSAPANTTLAVPNNAGGILSDDGATTTFACITFTGGNNSTGVSNSQNSVIDINSGVTFGTFGTNSTHVSAGQSSTLNVNANYTISGSASVHLSVSSGAYVNLAGRTITIPSALAFTNFVTMQGGYLNVAGLTFTGSGVAGTTGEKYVKSNASDIQSGSVDLNSLFPGSANGAEPNIGNGADHTFGVSFSRISACIASMTGMGYWISDSNTAVIGAVEVGAGSISAQIECNGSNWIVTATATPVLPNPSASTLGGIESIIATAHQWIDSIPTSGAPHQSQPACGDLSDATTPCNGSATAVRTYTEQGMTLLNVVTVSAAANISDTSSFTSAYNDYLIMLDNIVPATNGVNFNCQVQSGGSFQTSGYVSQGGATSYFDLLAGSSTLSNAVGYGYSGQLWLHGANSASYKALIARNDLWWSAAGTIGGNSNAIGAWTGGPGAITGIQCQASTGNVTGTMSIYGLRKAL
jgi:hypothetical protein